MRDREQGIGTREQKDKSGSFALLRMTTGIGSSGEIGNDGTREFD